ncbi:MAG: hypothetical protein DI549_16690 [Ancylobacter novellus]|uniref:Uncharacterized protein n=1 Tax=Ancylobacter novellus TaxID=921 RepID=A0A2W5QTW6_ANCNO|nr:MAG: hypothetical protein DI549_16690 [Ancylobacter novellus]
MGRRLVRHQHIGIAAAQHGRDGLHLGSTAANADAGGHGEKILARHRQVAVVEVGQYGPPFSIEEIAGYEAHRAMGAVIGQRRLGHESAVHQRGALAEIGDAEQRDVAAAQQREMLGDDGLGHEQALHVGG